MGAKMKAVCPEKGCGKDLLVVKGTTNRRWECPEHGHQGGDKVVDWVEQ